MTTHRSPARPHDPPRPGLRALGWDDAWARALADHFAARTGPVLDGAATTRGVGRVTRTDVRSCDVLVPADDGALVATGVRWHPHLERAVSHDPAALPVAGDWVVLTPEPADGTAHPERRVEAVLPRRTAVVRAQVRGSSFGQVLAANADVAAVVEAMDPDLDHGRLERLLALAWSSGARPAVVLTKADRAAHPEALVREVEDLAPGVEVHAVATLLGEGLDPLRGWLAGGATVALLGASGVGKSTLLNALVAGDGMHGPMATRDLGAASKGRHTTVTRELHPAAVGGAVLDTPGMRAVGLAAGADVDAVFRDVEDLAATCRFDDCAHRTEPGCAVLAALDDGTLSTRRLDSWRKLQRELTWQAARTDQRLRAELHRERRRAERQHRATRPRP